MSEPAPIPLATLRGATLRDGRVVDVAIDGDTVVAVVDAGTLAPSPDGEVVDLTGYLLVTAPAEPHGHLDKALSWDEIQPPFGDLERAVESWHAYSDAMRETDILARARRAARRMLAHGTTAVRSHVDLLPGPDPLRGVRALVALREELRGLMDLELVALGGWQTPDEVFDAALDAGVDLVGGAPHLSPDPLGDLERVLAIARRRGVGVDLHTDESLDGAQTLSAYAETVADWTVIRSAGHCVRLSTLEPHALRATIDDVLRADIGLITLPITNLYLQGWQHEHAVPRGIAPVRQLLDAGVRVGAGADNIRDPFNPVGRCDALETASLLVSAAHLPPDDALTAVTDGARDVMGLPVAGPVVGARADLLAVRATNVGEAVAFADADRFVIHRGHLVSRTRVDGWTAASPSTLPTTSIGKRA